MPEKTLAPARPFYHGLIKKYADRPLDAILSIGSYDQGEAWARERRFALPQGCKYFADSPETVAAEIVARLRPILAVDGGLQDVPLADRVVVQVMLKTQPRVLSVLEATQDAACAGEFVTEFEVGAEATLSKDDYGPSHLVGDRVDRNRFAGIEYPSVRRVGGVNCRAQGDQRRPEQGRRDDGPAKIGSVRGQGFDPVRLAQAHFKRPDGFTRSYLQAWVASPIILAFANSSPS
jgi:hypothetical protein